ncbi:hypothetical protein LTR78_009483 [Recurvomyces mirabilis]|uniref:Uncharacterized protein n=2 Tax=Recurvomyces mirabilis TaxID=574656 RepID=A0AAE0TNH8_9PEZI|nr:hypothetical protein LTR78_009483 [Recurvomyces mirabilis]
MAMQPGFSTFGATHVLETIPPDRQRTHGLLNVLKAPERLRYQNAFLTSELQEIFDNAPTLPAKLRENIKSGADAGNHRSLDDDCPTCSLKLEVMDRVRCTTHGNNLLTGFFKQWAKVKAGDVLCGSDLHEACFKQWAKVKAGGRR